MAISLFAVTVTAIGQTEISYPNQSSSEPDPYLSELGTILGRSELPLEVHLCFVGEEQLSEVDVAQGAVLAEGLALRAGYRPLLVSYGAQLEPEKFNVLIGTVDQLRNFIPDPDGKRIKSGYVAIERTRGQKNGFYLFVAGRTASDLESTIIDFGFTRTRFPDNSSSFISEVVLPEPAQFTRRAPLEDDRTLTFAQLEDRGATIIPLKNGGVSVNVFFAAYLRTDTDAQVTIDLHLRSADSLRLKLNGQDISADPSRPVRTRNGDLELSTAIPVRLFLHGRNVLTISAADSASSGGGVNIVKVFADSKITVPKLMTGPKLPDLQLVSRTFYPFIGKPDGSDLAIVLAERDSDTIEAAWTLLSRLAQSANTAFYAAQLSFGHYDSGRHNIVIGTYSHLSPALRRIVDLRAFDEANTNVPLADLITNPSTHNLKHFIERVLKENRNPAKDLTGNVREGELSQRAISVREFGLIAIAKVPSEASRWSLVVTAFTEQNLLRRVQNLVQPAFWDQVRGDMARWKEESGSFQAHVPGEARDMSASVAVELPLGERFDLRIWVCLICGTLVIYVFVTALILRRIERTARLRRPK